MDDLLRDKTPIRYHLYRLGWYLLNTRASKIAASVDHKVKGELELRDGQTVVTFYTKE